MTLFEQLAAIEHERWADWQHHVHGRMQYSVYTNSWSISDELYRQWERQIATPYADLSEKEKESDREQVRRYWPLIEELTQKNDKLRELVANLSESNEEFLANFDRVTEQLSV